MNFSFKDLDSITIEQAYDFPPEGIHRVFYRCEIDSNGNVFIDDHDEKEEKELVSKKESVENLFNDLIKFVSEINNVEVTIDDTSRTVILHFKNYVNIEIPLYAKNKNDKFVSDIIDSFINNCAEIKKGE